MSLKLYNTMSNKLEDFVPQEAGKVKMYSCGPTVYDFAHIGNFRSFLCSDLLRRYMEYKGWDVHHVMNITDVGHLLDDADEGEDKLETQAKKEKKDPWQIAEFYTKAFFDAADTLRMQRAHEHPKATDFIKQMIAIIENLIKKEVAYEVNGNVYYSIEKFSGYGKLSGNTLDNLDAGARVEVNHEKRHPMDFALWKHDPKHIMKWPSPWSEGFPGWHIECSAMSMNYLGQTLDLHTGGEDNIFPHHECEIAQSEAHTGKPFSKYWFHTRYLLVEGEKMSKSKGNFYTPNDLIEKGYSADSIRYSLISSHYRQNMNFTLGGLDAAATALERIQNFSQSLKEIASPAPQSLNDSHSEQSDAISPHVSDILKKAKEEFDTSLDDDLNISGGLAALFDMIKILKP